MHLEEFREKKTRKSKNENFEHVRNCGMSKVRVIGGILIVKFLFYIRFYLMFTSGIFRIYSNLNYHNLTHFNFSIDLLRIFSVLLFGRLIIKVSSFEK